MTSSEPDAVIKPSLSTSKVRLAQLSISHKTSQTLAEDSLDPV